MPSITLPAVAAVGAGISAVSAVATGISAGNAASFQSQVAANNATIARQNAAHAAAAGAAATEAAGLKARAKSGSLRAALAANGTDVNSGSDADVQVGERQLGYLETATVNHNAALNVYGYKTQAANFEGQSNLDSAEAGFAPIAGALKGAGGFASAYSDFAGGGGSSGGGAATETGTYDVTHGEGFNSLLSGSPSISGDSSWMYSASNPTDGKY